MRLARCAWAALQLAVLVGVLLAGIGWVGSWSIRPYPSEVLAALVDITAVMTPVFLAPALILGLLNVPVRSLVQVVVAGGQPRGRGMLWLLGFGIVSAVAYGVSRYTWSNAFDLEHDVSMVVAVPAALGFVWVTQVICAKLWSRLPRPRAELWLITGLVLLSVLVLGPVQRVRPGWLGPLVFAIYVLLGTTLAVVLSGRSWPRGLQGGVGAIGVTCLTLLALGVGGGAFRHPMGRPALQVLRVLGDNDADGFSGWLDGGDCDDGDPTINPLALEVVGNGRDDNCRAGDLQVAVALPTSPAKAGANRPDVVLISIDTLRADMLTAEFMPNLWNFAQGGRRYTNAYSAASFTDLSLRSLFTGWPASDFDIAGVVTGMDRTLADLMSETGWETYALHPVPNLGELVLLGFQRINSTPSARHLTPNGTSAPLVTALALGLLKQQSPAPRLLWTHYYEPHHRYLSHPGFERFGDSSVGRYHQEVAFVDQQLVPLLQWLSRPEVASHTVVVLFADHGEYLGERGGSKGHDLTLFQPVMRVPLLLRAPGMTGATVATPVSLLDVFPTVLALAGITGVEPRAGFNLLDAPSQRPLLAEARNSQGGSPSIALRINGELLYCVESANHCELCDERADPECLRPDVSRSGLTRSALYQQMGVLLDSYRNDVRHRSRKEAFVARWSEAAPR